MMGIFKSNENNRGIFIQKIDDCIPKYMLTSLHLCMYRRKAWQNRKFLILGPMINKLNGSPIIRYTLLHRTNMDA